MMKALRRPIPSPQHLLSRHQCRHSSVKPRNGNTRLQENPLALEEVRSALRKRRRAARTARYDEWFRGPLAPRMDLVDKEWGCVSQIELTGVKGTRPEDKVRAKMGWEECLIEVGDRVVIIAQEGPESRDRGRIGIVSEVRKDNHDVIIEDLNLADVTLPSYIQIVEPASPPIRTIPFPIPFASIRLVYPLSIDGRLQDCIISKLIRVPGPGNANKRFIANSDKATGQFLEIPIKPKPDEKPEKKDHDSDTLRFQVEEETWTPTLLRAPMPGSVIDELRGKYSKSRTRHEPAYALAAENREKRKAAYKTWVKSGGGMLLTPAREARLKERSELIAKGKPELKPEVLERIGEVMAGKGIEMTEARNKNVERNFEKEREGVLRSFFLAREEEEAEQERRNASAMQDHDRETEQEDGDGDEYEIEQDEELDEIEDDLERLRVDDDPPPPPPPSTRNTTTPPHV